MKRKKRVRRGERIAILRASEGGERERSAKGREGWREWGRRLAELRRWRRLPKKRVTLNLDADVLAWFRERGRGYQWEINRALRRVVEGEKKAVSHQPSAISKPGQP